MKKSKLIAVSILVPGLAATATCLVTLTTSSAASGTGFVKYTSHSTNSADTLASYGRSGFPISITGSNFYEDCAYGLGQIIDESEAYNTTAFAKSKTWTQGSYKRVRSSVSELGGSGGYAIANLQNY